MDEAVVDNVKSDTVEKEDVVFSVTGLDVSTVDSAVDESDGVDNSVVFGDPFSVVTDVDDSDSVVIIEVVIVDTEDNFVDTEGLVV